jgi:hypothetical protein
MPSFGATGDTGNCLNPKRLAGYFKNVENDLRPTLSNNSLTITT